MPPGQSHQTGTVPKTVLEFRICSERARRLNLNGRIQQCRDNNALVNAILSTFPCVTQVENVVFTSDNFFLTRICRTSFFLQNAELYPLACAQNSALYMQQYPTRQHIS